jgi:threonine synthase
MLRPWSGIIHAFRGRLALPDVPPVTLHEGNTPLVPAPRLARWIGVEIDLRLKLESQNPTGSFKDRGMTAAMTQAVADGAEAVVCASTGNTAAAAAAYAVRAGLKCLVLIPQGNVALGKLAGAIAYGARVVQIEGSFDDGLRMVRELAAREPIALVNSVNPARLEGQKTAAWEVLAQFEGAPDWLCLPVGNAGNITAYWMGFGEEGAHPRLLGAQAAGANPLVRGETVTHPETRATAIRIGNPARGDQALAALRQSNGVILDVTDDEIFEAYRAVARLEGIFCEPSSAAGLAGLRKRVMADPGAFAGRRVACVLTGHGLKDPDSATEGWRSEPPIPPTTDALLARLENSL